MEVHLENVQQLYPDCIREGRTWFNAPADYDPLLNSMGRILVRWDQCDYQGDTVALMERGGQYGILIFGWGSCSGCDALQACESYRDIHDLRRELFDRIQWGTVDETIAWVRDHDWRGSFLIERFPAESFIKTVERALRGDPLGSEPYIVKSLPRPPVYWPANTTGVPGSWGVTRRVAIPGVPALTDADLFKIDPALMTLTSVHEIAAHLNNAWVKEFPPPDDDSSDVGQE